MCCNAIHSCNVPYVQMTCQLEAFARALYTSGGPKTESFSTSLQLSYTMTQKGVPYSLMSK